MALPLTVGLSSVWHGAHSVSAVMFLVMLPWQTARLTAERSQLGEELRKVECERERVAALQTASAEEAKHLMAQQQQELQEAIAQEKEALATIERWGVLMKSASLSCACLAVFESV